MFFVQFHFTAFHFRMKIDLGKLYICVYYIRLEILKHCLKSYCGNIYTKLQFIIDLSLAHTQYTHKYKYNHNYIVHTDRKRKRRQFKCDYILYATNQRIVATWYLYDYFTRNVCTQKRMLLFYKLDTK